MQGIPVTTLGEALPALPECDVIVDALFGTGLCRMIDGAAQALINLVNEAGKPIIAVDIPSGVDGTTGEARAMGPILAIETVTFHRIKQGLLLGAGPVCAGEITVQPILIPPAEDDACDGLLLCGPGDLRRMIPSRAADMSTLLRYLMRNSEKRVKPLLQVLGTKRKSSTPSSVLI